MKTYSDELKASLLTRMLPPNPVSVPVLAREYGIPRDTLYGWRRQAGDPTGLVTTPGSPVGVLSGAEKFAAVVETAGHNELDLGAYRRRKGLFAEQIATWRTACQRANEPQPTHAERTEQRAEREQINQLSKELQRKDKALAEAAALLLLQKKSGRSGRSPRALRHPRPACPGERVDRRSGPRGRAPSRAMPVAASIARPTPCAPRPTASRPPSGAPS